MDVYRLTAVMYCFPSGWWQFLFAFFIFVDRSPPEREESSCLCLSQLYYQSQYMARKKGIILLLCVFTEPIQKWCNNNKKKLFMYKNNILDANSHSVTLYQ